MINNQFSPWPSYTQEEADAVARVLLSNRVNYWTGTECREFEKEFSDWCVAEHAVALANGTVALELALISLGVGVGDEVIVTPRSFLASVSCVVAVGATPVFADVDADSQNITVETIQEVLTPRTKAVICVHLAGWPCDMDPIIALAAENNLYVIEDCAQAHGAKYRGRSVGTIGHFGAWSFCQDKIMTTGGEGGMLTTNSRDLWEKAWAYKDHGKSWNAVYAQEHPPGFRWLHRSFGTNWRMTEMQAVIGRIQLQRMNEWHNLRTSHARLYAEMFADMPAIRIPTPAIDVEHAWYKFYAFVRPESLSPGWNRDAIMAEIYNAGVPCYSGTCSEIYLEDAFSNTGLRPKLSLPVSRTLGETSLMFLVHPTLTKKEITKMCNVISKVLSKATQSRLPSP